jgi:hypothetical protein
LRAGDNEIATLRDYSSSMVMNTYNKSLHDKSASPGGARAADWIFVWRPSEKHQEDKEHSPDFIRLK